MEDRHVFRSTRQLTKHDGSPVDPTKGDHYGIIAIDKDGVEHHSASSEYNHSNWLWEDIIWWRYDDPTMLEMQTWAIADLRDQK